MEAHPTHAVAFSTTAQLRDLRRSSRQPFLRASFRAAIVEPVATESDGASEVTAVVRHPASGSASILPLGNNDAEAEPRERQVVSRR